MAVQRHDHDTDTTQRVDRYERERIVERPTQSAPPGTSNVNVGPTTGGPAVVANSAVWIVARVVTLFFTVIEVLLLFRFVLKLLGANAQQPLVDGLYRLTEPLVRPFQGIFPQAQGAAIDLPALLAVVFFFLLAALVVALVRAITGARAPS
ncbi:MAG: YggT family protein [Chloroflexi bacterium]|nr:MAG: YggT family protein [Chloroflexota bacterium]